MTNWMYTRGRLYHLTIACTLQLSDKAYLGPRYTNRHIYYPMITTVIEHTITHCKRTVSISVIRFFSQQMSHAMRDWLFIWVYRQQKSFYLRKRSSFY